MSTGRSAPVGACKVRQTRSGEGLTMRKCRGLPGIGADCLDVNRDQGGNEEATGQSKGMMPSWLDGATGSSSAAASATAAAAATAAASTSSSSSACYQSSCSRYHPYARKKPPGENVLRLLALREVMPSAKRSSRRLWGDATTAAATLGPSYSGHFGEVTDAKQALVSWLEAESLRHCTAKYCPLQPPPRSTIAAAFSPDGNTLASTHGDHTVKIICCRTGHCLKVLSGHRRTPWVVRFHPGSSEVLASGSLDNEVRLWDANTAECVGFRDFTRPIASLAFHAQGDLLAVASGHKLYIWQYTKEADAASPVIVLRTRRSLRAVHFHPHAAPLLLTAEVNDLDSPDCPMTVATSRGPGNGIHDSQAEAPLSEDPVAGAANADDDTGAVCEDGQDLDTDVPFLLHPLDFSSAAPMDVSPRPSYADSSPSTAAAAATTIGTANTTEAATLADSLLNVEDLEAENVSQVLAGDPGRSSPTVVGGPCDIAGEPVTPVSAARTDNGGGAPPPPPHHVPVHPIVHRLGETGVSGHGPIIWPMSSFANMSSQMLTQSLPPAGDFGGWELPFLHGWVQGQNQAGFGHHQPPPSFSNSGGRQSGLAAMRTTGTQPDSARGGPQPNAAPANVAASAALAALATAARIGAGSNTGAQTVGREQGGGMQVPHHPGVRLSVNQSHDGGGGRGGGGGPGRAISITNIGAVEAAQAAFAAAQAAAELPCTVKLRIWPHDIKRPSALLDPETCRLTIPHAVLCSEMGAHFSPCGRFLAACVACVLPSSESDLHGQGSRSMNNGSPGAGMSVHSPTQHPISAQQVIYELRVYSLEETTFGQVLASRAVRAAHCLTSIQFSPTSGHILLAYGRRHSSLLRSLVVDGNQTIPIYTILEVYRVSDMELVRVLPSAEDEVNVACFHPRVGGGLVYGTKEGKLRILRHDRTPRHLNPRRVHELEDELLEAERADPLSFGFISDLDDHL